LPPDLSGAFDTEHGRKADDLARDEIAVELGQNRVAEIGLFETLGEAQRADVTRPAERRRELDHAGGDRRVPWPLGSSNVVREVGGKEILEPAKPDEDEAAALSQVAGGHRLRQQRRRLRGPDRGRDEEVLLESAAVALVAQAGLEPVEAATEQLNRELPVGVLRVRGR